MIYGQVFKDIKESYTGGATDMYIPSNVDIEEIYPDIILDDLPITADELLYCYDINSLYPFVMKYKALPTGKIFYFEGGHIKNKTRCFRFLLC